jgi:hypothetical protein
MPPDLVDRCSLYQFAAMVDGYNIAHGNEPKPEAPSDAAFDQALEQYAEHEARLLNGG